MSRAEGLLLNELRLIVVGLVLVEPSGFLVAVLEVLLWENPGSNPIGVALLDFIVLTIEARCWNQILAAVESNSLVTLIADTIETFESNGSTLDAI